MSVFYRFHHTLGPIPQIPHYIVTNSTASIIDWDLFQCCIIYFVTLSTDATFCDLRHNRISKIISHLWNRAQFFCGNNHNSFCDLFHNALYPIPQFQVIVTNSTISNKCDQFHCCACDQFHKLHCDLFLNSL